MTYIQNINDNLAFERSLIKKGAVYEFLLKQTAPISDIEIAMELGLATPLVRQELNQLVNDSKIFVKQNPAQDLSSAGLVYGICDQVLSLCTGIGGFELATKLSGFQAVSAAFVEKDSDCQSLLKKRDPNTPIFKDIKDLTYEQLKQAGINRIDGIVGGLPCQPYSYSGEQQGDKDPRQLFPHYFRLLRRIRPKWSVIENVPGLLSIDNGRIFREILGQFSQERYAAKWETLSCADVGGSHQRERLFIIAYSQEKR